MKLHTIETGFFHSDGGAMFGLLPKSLWSKFYPSDKDNRCRLTMRCVLLEWPGYKILIDTGVGTKYLNRLTSYRFEKVTGLSQLLMSKGISPNEITDVVLSHLHFDHCGELARTNESGRSEIAFPNATYHVSKAQWERSRRPSWLDRTAFLPEDLSVVIPNEKLHLIEKAETIDNRIVLTPTDGHTPGQLVCTFDDDLGNRYLYPGDVIPTALHIKSECLSAADLNADESCSAKRSVLQKAVDENRIILFYHDAYTWGARIKRCDSFYSIAEPVLTAPDSVRESTVFGRTTDQ